MVMPKSSPSLLTASAQHFGADAVTRAGAQAHRNDAAAEAVAEGEEHDEEDEHG